MHCLGGMRLISVHNYYSKHAVHFLYWLGAEMFPFVLHYCSIFIHMIETKTVVSYDILRHEMRMVYC